jgi:catechol 2,3-dioxygenase-like lactoylglutathione lyase family enzyme
MKGIRMSKHTKSWLSAIAISMLGAYTVNAAAEDKKPVATAKPAQSSAPSPHNIGAAKLIIADVKQNQEFYEKVFGMKEVGHYTSEGVYDEPIMGFADGARLALFSPKVEPQLKKSQFPVALIYTPDLEATVAKLEEAKASFQRLPAAQSSTFKIAIARDPSGNAVEILERKESGYAVGGSKLIVADRQKAEEFYGRVFGAKPGQRFVTPAYDEVLMNFGEGPFLALFQPKAEAPLPKSQYPQTAIYTSEWDAVVQRVMDEGYWFRKVKSKTPGTRIIIAQDPSGNAIEIIARAPVAQKANAKKK